MPSDSRAALLKASTPPSDQLFNTLITANHILHHQKVLDAYGHISVRNPQNPATFFISRSLAPALVTCREDIEEYYVDDASPVNKEAPQGYAERFIHSELYKSYSDVNSVIHSHSEAVIPFSISSVPVCHLLPLMRLLANTSQLRPVYHVAGVLGSQIPVYDIALHYKSSDTELTSCGPAASRSRACCRIPPKHACLEDHESNQELHHFFSATASRLSLVSRSTYARTWLLLCRPEDRGSCIPRNLHLFQRSSSDYSAAHARRLQHWLGRRKVRSRRERDRPCEERGDQVSE
jgi:ribulose-5-phosphate 4-epimerase/fuculose-1-phosphate aldolase